MAAKMRYGDYLKGGWEIVKGNLVPSIVAAIVAGIPILGFVIQINYMALAKKAKKAGTPIEIGALFNFDNAANQIIGMLVWVIILSIGFTLCVIPGLVILAMTFYFPAILADKPGTGWMDALKGSMAFGKANLVPSLLLALVLGLVAGVGGTITCGLGYLVLIPLVWAAHYVSYEDHQSAIEAAAAEGGITLA